MKGEFTVHKTYMDKVLSTFPYSSPSGAHLRSSQLNFMKPSSHQSVAVSPASALVPNCPCDLRKDFATES